MEAIQKFFQALNNRELAILIWIVFAIIWCLFYPKIRKLIFSLIKSFFAWKLTLSYVMMYTYIACCIWVLKIIAIWKIDHIPVTILWSICVAFVMLFNFQKANTQNFFKNSIKDNIKGLVILEFVINIYVFNFWVEFIIVPISGIIGVMKAIAERSKEYEIIEKFLSFILIVFGIFLLFYSCYKIINDFDNFASWQNFESFYIPILLSILFIPFVYITALIATYESLFSRLKSLVQDKKVLRYTKFKTILLIQFNLSRLNRWSDFIYKNWRFKNNKEVKEALTAFKRISDGIDGIGNSTN